MRAAVLDRVAGFSEVLDAFVQRDDTRDLFAHFPTGFTTEQMRAVGINFGSEIAENFPFRARFADLPWNFGAESNSTLGRCFDSAVVLFVTRFRRKQDHFF